MAYAVIRMAKIKSNANAGGLNAHIERTMDVPNADPELSRYNQRLVGSGDLLADLKARHEALGYGKDGKEIRKNGVLANEFILTSSREAFPTEKRNGYLLFADEKSRQRWEGFKDASKKFLEDRYGKENLINFSIHMDELTPHIHAVITPVINGKLNSKAIFGLRSDMQQLQTDFAKAVAHLGLERGVLGSKAEHVSVREFYQNLTTENAKATNALQEIAQKAPEFSISPKGLFEGTMKWKEEQESSLKYNYNKHLFNDIAPVVKKSAAAVVGSGKLLERRDILEKENSEMRAAIRDIEETRKIKPSVIAQFLPDVAERNRKEAEAAKKAAEQLAKANVEKAREDAIKAIRGHELGKKLDGYQVRQLLDGKQVSSNLGQLSVYLKWDAEKNKVTESVLKDALQIKLFKMWKEGTLEINEREKNRGMSM